LDRAIEIPPVNHFHEKGYKAEKSKRESEVPWLKGILMVH